MNNTPVYREQGTGDLKTQAGGSAVFSIQGTATLAEINAGLTILQGIPDRQLKVIGGRLKMNGAFTTLTAIELQEEDGSPVIISIAQAQATDGAVFDFRTTTAGQTVDAGFNAALTAGKGVAINNTGSAGAGGTSVEYILDYVIAG